MALVFNYYEYGKWPQDKAQVWAPGVEGLLQGSEPCWGAKGKGAKKGRQVPWNSAGRRRPPEREIAKEGEKLKKETQVKKKVNLVAPDLTDDWSIIIAWRIDGLIVVGRYVMKIYLKLVEK